MLSVRTKVLGHFEARMHKQTWASRVMPVQLAYLSYATAALLLFACQLFASLVLGLLRWRCTSSRDGNRQGDGH